MTEMPAWKAVAATLDEIRATAGPAEAHGVLCGLLCAPAAEPATLWLRDALGREPDAPPPPPLDAVYRVTSRQLDDSQFDFEMLLPADEAELPERAAALAAWCSGFVYAVGISGVAERDFDDDAREFLADVAEIAKVDPPDGAAEEEAESAYTEIIEYLRVGALGMRTSAAARQPPAASDGDKGPGEQA